MRSTGLFLLCVGLTACGGGSQDGFATTSAIASADDTEAVQAAIDRGGVVNFEARTYHISKTIVIRQSDTIIQGVGPETVFEYKAVRDLVHCANDRVFTTPCDLDDVLPRRIAKPVAVGDTSFTAADDASDVQPGEWLLINDYDSRFGDRAAVDWVKVQAVAGNVVTVTAPFRMAFTTARSWVAGKSGLGFTRIDRLVQNVQFRNFSVNVPDTGNPADRAVGISVFMALNTIIDRVHATVAHAQPLYAYLSKGITVTNSEGIGKTVLNEFASSVDMTICNNVFAVERASALGVDLGAGFFDVCDNEMRQSRNIGAYLLYEVHDGKFRNNHIAFVDADFDAVGLMAWGVQNVEISYNVLDGGAGANSSGISVRDVMGEILVPTLNASLVGNQFGSRWAHQYEPGTL